MSTDPAEDLTRASAAGEQPPGPFGGADEEGPDDAAIRAELRARGHNPPKRGRLGRDWHALWESGEGADQADAEAAELAATGGVTAADFPRAHDDQVDGEARPGRPKARGWRERILGKDEDRGRGKHKGRGEKRGPRTTAPKHERVPLDRLGESAFDFLARAARADPPLSRTFSLEAPLVGMMADDAIQGTPLDKPLQVAARAQAKLRIGSAIIGMPLGIIALERAQALPEKQRVMREAVILPMLREAAVMWVEFAGEAIKRKAERDAQRGPLYEEADLLLRHLLYGDPLDAETVAEPGPAGYAPPPAAEDQAAAWAQHHAAPGFMGGLGHQPAPSQYAAQAAPQYGYPYGTPPPRAQLHAAQLVPRP